MRHFDFRNGELHAEDVPLSRIAAQVGTPVYVYSSATLERHYRVFAENFSGIDALIAYSVKANSNIAVLAALAKLGAGADIVSGGELARALITGIPGERIVFSGVGKTRDEMADALDARIKVFNVESLPELRALNEVALQKDVTAPIAFRVNPDVTAGAHAKISTGIKENKFGIAWSSAEMPMRKRRVCPESRLSVSMCILAARLMTLRRLKPRSARLWRSSDVCGLPGMTFRSSTLEAVLAFLTAIMAEHRRNRPNMACWSSDSPAISECR